MKTNRARPALLVLGLTIFLWHTSPSTAQRPKVQLPTIYANDGQGGTVVVDEAELCDFELRLRAQFARKDAPDEVFALAEGRPPDILLPELGRPVWLLTISAFGERGELRWYLEDSWEWYYYRDVSAEELKEIRTFLRENKAHDLPERTGERRNEDGSITATVGGVQNGYLHLTPQRGLRVLINNRPFDHLDAPAGHPDWRYTKLVEFFKKFADAEDVEVRYSFLRPVNGLEVLYASPSTDVLAVWKRDQDLCLTLRDRWDPWGEKEHRVFRDGSLGREVAGPPMAVEREALAGDLPLRSACRSPDGRWIVGTRRDRDELVCYDREQQVFVPVDHASTRKKLQPRYFLEAHNMFLLAEFPADWNRSISRGEASRSIDFRVLNPATGSVADLHSLPDFQQTMLFKRELWLQDLPRSLQPVQGRADVVWAAVPQDNAMQVAHFNTRQLRWLAQEYIPNLKFHSGQFWVDEANRKIYVAYKGNLLRIPLPSSLAAGGRNH